MKNGLRELLVLGLVGVAAILVLALLVTTALLYLFGIEGVRAVAYAIGIASIVGSYFGSFWLGSWTAHRSSQMGAAMVTRHDFVDAVGDAIKRGVPTQQITKDTRYMLAAPTDVEDALSIFDGGMDVRVIDDETIQTTASTQK